MFDMGVAFQIFVTSQNTKILIKWTFGGECTCHRSSSEVHSTGLFINDAYEVTRSPTICGPVQIGGLNKINNVVLFCKSYSTDVHAGFQISNCSSWL